MKSVSSDEKNEFPFTWDIWISDRDNNVQKLSEQIATIKGFWDLFDTEYPVAAIPQGVTLFLMKQGIPPQWYDGSLVSVSGQPLFRTKSAN